jgi:hypothetical protein
MQNIASMFGLAMGNNDYEEDFKNPKTDDYESAFNFSMTDEEKVASIKKQSYNQFTNFQNLSNMENGMGGIWNTEMFQVNTGNNTSSNRDNCCHFIYV